MEYIHAPVMPDEVLRWVGDSSRGGAGTAVDCTLGEGGHSELLLKMFDNLRVVAFERDARIIDAARGRLAPFGERVRIINDNFSRIAEHLAPGDADYILYDFGISSFHFEASGGGFGFARDERLDMRLDGEGPDARDLVNGLPERELADLIYRYGEERWSRRIAARICERRDAEPVETTGDLARLVIAAIPARYRVKNIHPATRVFQALRIAVNGELDAIEKSLGGAPGVLASGGRILAISFHSLEDRIVKYAFRRLARGCTCGADPAHCECDGEPVAKILTKKPVTPSVEECNRNPRARSAKLRVCEKI